MKIRLIILLLIPLYTQVFSQWSVQNSKINTELFSLYFVDNLNGWVVGQEGTLLKTIDGGINWEKIPLGIDDNLISIFFINKSVGFICGEHSFLKTTDAGINWFSPNNSIQSGQYGLYNVFFVDENNGWISTFGTEGKIFRTNDGGNTWELSLTQMNDYFKIFFADKNYGWAGNQEGTIFKTTDGGIHWEISTKNSAFTSDIFFINRNTGWVIQDNIVSESYGILKKTIDGGTSWTTQIFHDAYLTSFYFLNENLGWMIGGHDEHQRIYKTTNGGTTWKQEYYTANNVLTDIFFSDSTNGWVVGYDGGYNGIILKTDSTKFIKIISPNGGDQWAVNSYQNIKWSKNNIDSLRIFYSLNNGKSWTILADSVDADSSNWILGPVYTWDPVPNTPSNECLIKLVDIADSTVFDISDNVFSIVYNSQITIIRPNGGEKIGRGTGFQLQWETKYVNGVNFFYSLDNGITWSKIVDMNNYPSIWTVPNVVSDNCLIEIASIADSSVFDISDNNFKIIDYPKFSHFPLAVGNQWYFQTRYSVEESYKIENYQTLDDGKYYAKLNWYRGDNLLADGWAYLREESNKIIQYPNKIFIDYNMNAGDTVADGSALYQVLYENVFNTERTTYYFYEKRNYSNYSYTDSIGFNIIYKDGIYNFKVTHCKIDGKEYGTVTSLPEKENSFNNYGLTQNYPNPFNPTTKIEYSIPSSSYVTLKVYDLLGREVASLVNEEKPAGYYEVEFDGIRLTSGIYFYVLKSSGFNQSKKMILLK